MGCLFCVLETLVNPNQIFHYSTKTREMTKSKPIKAYLERDFQVVLASSYPQVIGICY